MKRNVTVFLSFLMVLLVITIGCTGKKTSTSTETITVGIASQSLKEQVYRDMQVGVEEKAKELGAVVEWQICDYDPQRELEIVNNYITKGVDVLIIEAVNTETSTPMMEAAFDANIPVVALETELLGGSGPVVRITCNFRRIGQAQVEKFIEDWGEGKPANVVILAGTNTDFVAQEIVYGNHDILDNHP
jgi:ribose transport system substrate-binding protein